MKTTDQHVELVLGFPEEQIQNFNRASFPSKIGGKPVFLLDEPAETPKCGRCDERLKFLCQLYAPVDVSHGEAFHRTLYVYVCEKATCTNIPGAVSVTVLRAQLPRRNDVYSYDGGGKDVPDLNCDLCALCGGKAVDRCSACKNVWYCGRKCQREDWRLGHKLVCRNEGDELKQALNKLEIARKKKRFCEVAIETEGWSDEESDVESDGDNQVPEEIRGTMQDAGDEELPEELFKNEREEDEVFDRFCRLTRTPADQIVRYMRGGECVWMHSKGRREQSAGKCVTCGGDMIFEFQVLPQAIYYAEGRTKKSGSIGEVVRRLRDVGDWGVIAVYTCTNSCAIGHKYVREQAWLQPNV